eukprot:3731371-Rhodomonas_salina.1
MNSSVHGGDADGEREHVNQHLTSADLCRFQDIPSVRREFQEIESCQNFRIGGQVMTVDGYFARIRAIRIEYGWYAEKQGSLEASGLPEGAPALQRILMDLEVTGLGMRCSVPATEIYAKSEFSSFRDCLSSDSTVIFSASPATSQVSDVHFDKTINSSSGLTPAASQTWSPILQQQECSELRPDCPDLSDNLSGHRAADCMTNGLSLSQSATSLFPHISGPQHHAGDRRVQSREREIAEPSAREVEPRRQAESQPKAQRDIGIQSTGEPLEESAICVKAAELGAMLDRGGDYALMMRCFHLWQVRKPFKLSCNLMSSCVVCGVRAHEMGLEIDDRRNDVVPPSSLLQMMMFCRVQYEEGARQLEETKLELER